MSRLRLGLLILASPLLLALLCLLLALIAAWAVLCALFDSVALGALCQGAVLLALTVHNAVVAGGSGRHELWDVGVIGLAALLGSALALRTEQYTAKRVRTRILATCMLILTVVYTAIFTARSVRDAGASLPTATRALVALTFLAPVSQLIIAFRLWRWATPEACAAAEARIFKKLWSVPFEQYTVAGLHTVQVGYNHVNSPVPAPAPAATGALTPTAAAGHEASKLSDALTAHTNMGVTSPSAATKPAIVFLHGYMSGAALFLYNLDAFAPEYRVFAVDWRGSGASPRQRYTPKTTAETEDWFVSSLESWRRAQGIDSFVLVGHSMGGYLASAYALAYPRNVQHLVLVSPGGIPAAPPPTANGGVRLAPNVPAQPGEQGGSGGRRVIPGWLWTTVSYLWDNNVTPGVLLRGLGPFGHWMAKRSFAGRASRFVLSKPLDKVALDLGDYFYHNLASGGAGEFALTHIFAPGAFARVPMGARLIAAATHEREADRLACPVTFLYGGTHDWMTASAGDKVVDALRAAGNARARVYRISPGGHHLYLESPDTFNDKVLHELRQTFGAERVNTAQPAHVSSGQKASAVPPGATLGFADVERSGDTQPDALDVAATLE